MGGGASTSLAEQVDGSDDGVTRCQIRVSHTHTGSPSASKFRDDCLRPDFAPSNRAVGETLIVERSPRQAIDTSAPNDCRNRSLVSTTRLENDDDNAGG